MVLVGPIPENTFTVRTHGRQQKPPTDANGDIKRHVVGQGMAGIRSDQSPFTIKPHEVTGHNAERNDDEVANAERVLKSSYDAGAGDIRCVIGSGVGARHGLSRVKKGVEAAQSGDLRESCGTDEEVRRSRASTWRSSARTIFRVSSSPFPDSADRAEPHILAKDRRSFQVHAEHKKCSTPRRKSERDIGCQPIGNGKRCSWNKRCANPEISAVGSTCSLGARCELTWP